MGKLSEMPATSRIKAYDYCGATWRAIAANISGEVIVANGETLITGATVLAPNSSGGIVLASGTVERVHIRVPELQCSGDIYYNQYINSGLPVGIWVGGRSGTGYEPYNYSGGCITSGYGLWLPPGGQKEIHVRKLEEIHVLGEPSGYPVTYLAEVIVC